MLPLLFTQHRDMVDQVVDASFEYHRLDDSFLSTLYPIVEVPDWQYIAGILDYQVPIAYVLGDDGEIPSAAQSMDFTQFAQSFARMGIAEPYDQKRLMQLLELSRKGFDATALATLFFQPQARLVDAVMDLRNLLTMAQIFNLSIDYEDPRTHVRVELDLRSLGDSSLFPAPLTGADRWSQQTTARGLEDLDRLNGAYYDVNEEYPDGWVMSRQTGLQLLAQDSTRAFMQNNLSITVTTEGLSTIPRTPEQMLGALNSILAQQTMNNGQPYPELIMVDKTVRRQLSNNVQETDRYRIVPTGKIAAIKRNTDSVLTPSGTVTNAMGITAFGPNLESAIAELMPEDVDVAAILDRMSTRPFVWASKIHDSAFAVKCVANAIPIPLRPKTYSSQQVD